MKNKLSTEHLAGYIARHRLAVIERELITVLEELLGRVPSNHEVKANARRLVHPDGREDFKWGDRTLFTVYPMDRIDIDEVKIQRH